MRSKRPLDFFQFESDGGSQGELERYANGSYSKALRYRRYWQSGEPMR
jgi:hypothetical protein